MKSFYKKTRNTLSLLSMLMLILVSFIQPVLAENKVANNILAAPDPLPGRWVYDNETNFFTESGSVTHNILMRHYDSYTEVPRWNSSGIPLYNDPPTPSNPWYESESLAVYGSYSRNCYDIGPCPEYVTRLWSGASLSGTFVPNVNYVSVEAMIGATNYTFSNGGTFYIYDANGVTIASKTWARGYGSGSYAGGEGMEIPTSTLNPLLATAPQPWKWKLQAAAGYYLTFRTIRVGTVNHTPPTPPKWQCNGTEVPAEGVTYSSPVNCFEYGSIDDDDDGAVVTYYWNAVGNSTIGSGTWSSEPWNSAGGGNKTASAPATTYCAYAMDINDLKSSVTCRTVYIVPATATFTQTATATMTATATSTQTPTKTATPTLTATATATATKMPPTAPLWNCNGTANIPNGYLSPVNPAVCKEYGSTDPDGSVITYYYSLNNGSSWSNEPFNGDNVPTKNITAATTICAYAVDNDGLQSATTCRNIVFANQPPTPPIWTCLPGFTSTEAVNCRETGSTDADGTVVTYYYNTGSGWQTEPFNGDDTVWKNIPTSTTLCAYAVDNDGLQSTTTCANVVIAAATSTSPAPTLSPPVGAFSLDSDGYWLRVRDADPTVGVDKLPLFKGEIKNAFDPTKSCSAQLVDTFTLKIYSPVDIVNPYYTYEVPLECHESGGLAQVDGIYNFDADAALAFENGLGDHKSACNNNVNLSCFGTTIGYHAANDTDALGEWTSVLNFTRFDGVTLNESATWKVLWQILYLP